MATQVQNNVGSLSKAVVSGALAGAGGGVVFGIMMGMLGMLPMVGMLAGSEQAAVGFGVHMVISAFIGAVYGLIIQRFPLTGSTALVGGAINGVVWWVLGALILMPVMLGMSNMVFQVGEMQIMSLIGHLIYGVVTGFLYNVIRPRV
jgi:uncharacterized membrane protein YagU involved in acid resistance